MFPEDFVRANLQRHTKPSESVCDPFSGRGTTLLQALLMGRNAIATDINPVAYCISAAKARVPRLKAVEQELNLLEKRFHRSSRRKFAEERAGLPAFFRRAFHHTTLNQLLFLRSALRWRRNRTHCFITALVLGSLHGEMDKSDSYFSNQMPRTISTKPVYSIKYWKRHRLWARKRDVFEILGKRARFRLSTEVPSISGEVALSDARKIGQVFTNLKQEIKLVVTSPPYLNVTNYEEDQWLRLWFLGNAPWPTYRQISKDDRHQSNQQYWQFLQEVWKGLKPLLTEDAILVCRLGAKDVKKLNLSRAFMKSIRAVFPRAEFLRPPVVSRIRNRQTDLFRPGTTGCLFEVDYSVAVGARN